MSQQLSKALFQKKSLKNALVKFKFPSDLEQRHQIIIKWVEALNSGTLNQVKEISLHGDFLKDIFQNVLGYSSIITGGGKVWEIHAEQTIADGGGSADAAVGFFTATENNKGKVKLQGKVVAPIELKGTKDDLDRPAPGRKESAVDQGWRYANYTPDCHWIIVSNYRELRLYHTNKTPAYYEQFLLTNLADFEEFKKFYLLLCRENFLPIKDISTIDRLLVTSEEAQEDITKQLYEEYKQVRLNIVKDFRFRFGSKLHIPNRDQVLIEKAQKTLDRILFIAFCEDRGLLPEKTISKAYNNKDIYHPRPIWENYQAVFRWVDQGNEDPPIPGYNGGLFQHDPILDQLLDIPDSLCGQLQQLTRFDFDSEVSVDILGRIFEQSITDLEELKADVAKQEFDKKQGKRKKLGVFYTPAYITQYIVEVAIGGYLQKREYELRQRLKIGEFIDTAENQKREIEFWRSYRDEVLVKTRVLDPACGSGAFLIAAFDYFAGQYQRVNDNLRFLKYETLENIELDKTILSNNLFGVDLSPESVEITKLSLWLKTATQGKTLTYLDDNIKIGNSIINDAKITDLPFNWESEFSQVFADGGFDVVIGNPPYIRQELLSPFKPYLQENYQTYDGVADIYIYFYEKGLNLLKPAGIISYIVTNKWLRSGYGESLRRFFCQSSVFEQIIDFGHAPIFADADTFPCIIAARKITPPQPSNIKSLSLSSSLLAPPSVPPLRGEEKVLVCAVPRGELKNINLIQYVQNPENSFTIPWSRFTAHTWSLEPPAVDDLMGKIQRVGVPLKEFAGVKPYRGIMTGFNEAFFIDDTTKNKLIQADPKCAEIIKPYLRGQDIKRWCPAWENLWMIFVKWDCPINNYPSVLSWLEQHRKGLELRPEVKQRKFPWYALSRYGADYWHLFEQQKIIYQVIQTFPLYALDNSGVFGNDKTFILPTQDLFILGLLNSPLIWWYGQRVFTKMLSDAISPMGYLFETLPIAQPTEETRAEVEAIVTRLIEITKINGQVYQDVLDWLQIEYKIEKLGNKLEDFATWEFPDFVDEVRKRMPKQKNAKKYSDPLSIPAFRALRQAYNDYVPEINSRKNETVKLEQRLSDLINQAYQLTAEEIDLMWKTAPPRMPI
ncbi:Eco57I restriction-modification methylase domain-containing protein [Dolichospermum circinale]|uniref:Eco57I restriction-modification methylase domain-containing protein n=1 Tax=Dolichospermum circinale TaxID=109265 RepID=UPI00232D1CC6|nr:Eco57I restriction-modification methylase domain-containing protein [Dolichospermum circinale]MDB9465124.1 Eco57I restriction-modification methylase domain-containing protein [Dolichospermum circinale CS-539/09]MDB9472865.1 Eco57I restriction-modification methylase domain-containing protein [Dolichospermum circinale CS-539]